MDTVLECLTDWMTRQRWYAGKGRQPQLREMGAWELPVDEPGVLARTLLVMDDAARPAVLYQVPITQRTALLPGAGHRLICRAESGEYLYDGAHDPVYTEALLRLILEQRSAESQGVAARGERSSRTGIRDASGLTASVLEGEQSNTSIIYRAADATPPVIVKLFRQLHQGENPDVTLQTALSEAGSNQVPGSVGTIVGEWDDSGRASGRAQGHLAFAQEFLPGAEDAWRVATRAAAEGGDFTAEARAIGVATGEVHRMLAELFGAHPATPGEIAGVVFGWHERLAAAVAEVPQLEPHRAAIEQLYDRAQSLGWPALQRVHGDLHLGQVISAPGRDWMLLDFEGEPMRPMADRVRPDVVLRDVAGMLRSFDYVAGSVGLEQPSRPAEALADWANAARSAFLSGYAEVGDIELRAYQTVCDAFELDKAVYEVLYEQRNRQDWLPIPLLGVMRLTAPTDAAGRPPETDAFLSDLDESRRG